MTEPMEPCHIAISPMDDGQWGWDIFYDDEAKNRGGVVATVEEALWCVEEVLLPISSIGKPA